MIGSLHVSWVEWLTVGTAAFVSTNVDDILLLAVWFAQRGRRVPSIVFGQYLGIGVLVGVSAIAALTALVLPRGWIPLMGLLPLALGIRGLRRPESDEPETTPSGTGVWSVAAVTVANGGDNVGVYIPLFAKSPEAVVIYAVIFAVGTAIWCALGYTLVSHPAAKPLLEKYAHRLMPWVLIGIGVHVLSGFRL